MHRHRLIAPRLSALLRNLYSQARLTTEDRCIKLGEPVSFEEILIPFVRLGRWRIVRQAGAAYGELVSHAHADLEHAFLLRLAHISERVLGLEFSVWRATHPRGRSNIGYQSFVEYTNKSKLNTIRRHYPVLLRLMACCCSQFVETSLEFLRRLRNDRADLRNKFSHNVSLGKVTAVEAMLSDPHEGGRSVFILTFGSGIRVVYKPRPLEMEDCFNRLVQWVNEQTSLSSLKAYAVLTRRGYGWAEYVPQAACCSLEQHERYSVRAGMLVFLAYLLDATDLHIENVRACGEHPVIVDLETLLHPWVRPPASCLTGSTVELEGFRRSVLRSGLLPASSSPTAEPSDLCAFHRTSQVIVPLRRMEWVAVNSDAMKMIQRSKPLTLSRTAVNPESVITGFRNLYSEILRHRENLLTSCGPLAPFSAQEVRFVFRATRDYLVLLKASFSPTALRSSTARQNVLKALFRVVENDGSGVRPNFWALIEAEFEALKRAVVPRFTAETSTHDINLPSGAFLPEYFLESGAERLFARVAQLNEDDLEVQTEIIRTALQLHNSSPAEANLDGEVEKSRSGSDTSCAPRSPADLPHESHRRLLP
jgi:type 2 lantibiotic biosynthesis protein LanM